MKNGSSSRLQAGQYRWVQPATGENRFELFCPEQPEGAPAWGTLVWRSFWGTLAEASSPVGNWTFKRVGFLNPRITVREAGQEGDLALFTPRWTGGGALEFRQGGEYSWGSANFWGTRWAFKKGEGEPLLTFGPQDDAKFRDLFKVQGHVEVTPTGAGLAEAALLLFLGWYLVIMHRNDSAAVVAAT